LKCSSITQGTYLSVEADTDGILRGVVRQIAVPERKALRSSGDVTVTEILYEDIGKIPSHALEKIGDVFIHPINVPREVVDTEPPPFVYHFPTEPDQCCSPVR
jgi:hypothetical protein